MTNQPTGQNDLLTLLQRVSSGQGNAAQAPAASVTPTGGAPVPETPQAVTPSAPALPEPGAEAYAQITIEGLRKYRPDMVKALEKPRRGESAPKAGTATHTRPAGGGGGKDPADDFTAYREEAVKMLATDPASVSGRRLANMRQKYIRALQAKGVQLPADTDVQFVINGGNIDATWSGTKPESLPEGLNL